MKTLERNPLPARLAAQAEQIVNTFTQSDYQYDEQIDAAAGVYDCDCNSFVGFVLEGYASRHYELISPETASRRPLAFQYCRFFLSLTPTSTGGWHRIERMADARRGDILAWQLPAADKDTGHVMFLAETPEEEEGVFTVRVYDSAAHPHFEDTRTRDYGASATGLGTGFIRFEVNQAGHPTAFLFGPPDLPERFETVPIAIGRTEPFTT